MSYLDLDPRSTLLLPDEAMVVDVLLPDDAYLTDKQWRDFKNLIRVKTCFDPVITEGEPQFHALLLHLHKNKMINNRGAANIIKQVFRAPIDPKCLEFDDLAQEFDKHGRNFLKVFLYLRAVGNKDANTSIIDIPDNRNKLKSLFGLIEEVLNGMSVHWTTDSNELIRLTTIGDIRKIVGHVEYLSLVRYAHVLDDGDGYCERASRSNTSAQIVIKNRVIGSYLESHPEAAVEIARFVIERYVNASYADGIFAIDWYESKNGAQALKDGEL